MTFQRFAQALHNNPLRIPVKRLLSLFLLIPFDAMLSRMLWVRAFHVIFMVTWFAGVFYLPRLFVYHALAKDDVSNERFKVMERKLYRGIMTPGGILTTVFGLWLLLDAPKVYFAQGWMHAKLGLIILLWAYHLLCGYYKNKFAIDQNTKSHLFYRYFNEIPVLLLVAIVILVIVKPF